MIRTVAWTVMISIAGAMPCIAELAPRDVWDNWKNYMQSMGYTVSANVVERGDVLTAENIVGRVSTNIDAVKTDVSVGFGDLTYRAVSQDTVSIELPNSILMPVTIVVSDGKSAETTAFTPILNFGPGGFNLSASGSVEDITYVFDGAKAEISMRINAPEEGIESKADMALTDIKGTIKSAASIGQMTNMEQDVSFGNVILRLLIASLENDQEFIDASIDMTSVVSFSKMSYPDTVDFQNMRAALDAGLTLSSRSSVKSMQINLDGDIEDSGPIEGVLRIDDLGAVFEFDDRSLVYATTSQGLHAELANRELPFPFSYGVKTSVFNMAFPTSTSPETVPARIELMLDGVTLDAALWDMFDPSQALDRAPVDFEVGVSSTISKMLDFWDPSAILEIEDMDGFEFVADNVDLERFRLKFAGAELDATGDIKLNYAQGNPVPVPAGKLDITGTGVQTLIQSLTQMGIIPDEQIFAVQMMLGMFTRPGDTEGSLVSAFEFKENGEVFVNGQRIQ